MNLLNSPGFVAGIPPAWGADTGATLVLLTTDNVEGISAANCGRWQSPTTNAGMFTEDTDIALASPYVYSLYVKNNGGATNGRLIVRDNVAFSEVASAPITLVSTWTRYSIAFTSHAANSPHYLILQGFSGTGFDALVDAFQLEPGSSPTPYSEPGFAAGGRNGGRRMLLGVG